MKTPDEIARRSTRAARGRHRVMSLGTFAAVVGLVACMHIAFWALKKPDTSAASVEAKLPSVSYNRFAAATPDGLRIPEAQIRTDLTENAKHATPVRTEASTKSHERLPATARHASISDPVAI